MKWSENLRIGSRIAADVKTIREKLEAGEDAGRIWLIMPAANGKDLLDLRPASDLKKEYFRDKDPLILGLAGSREEAVSMVPQIVEEYLKNPEEGFH